MVFAGRRWFSSMLLVASLSTVFTACKREDPQILALTAKASQADEAAQQLRQAWSEQFRRLGLAGVGDLRFAADPLLLTEDQKKALEARIRIEKDTSRQGLLREILEKDAELRTLNDHLVDLKAALPAPEIARPNDSHYGLALRFLKSHGHSDAEARKALSRVILSERLAPGFEVYHFYVNGDYGTWVSQGTAPITPRSLARQNPNPLIGERDQAVAVGRRLQRELRILESQKQGIEQEIAAIQAERALVLEGQARLQSENAEQLARLNSLHYLVGVQDTLEQEGIIEVPLFGKNQSGRSWRDAAFTQNLDLRSDRTLLIRAQDLGLRQISRVSVVPGSYTQNEHYRLSISSDRQTARVELLSLPRFKNDKVVFAVAE
ncbi:hypothetical protein [Geothrix campi]|uniref:hypothetical protein n=1 Tax=Geothrix campi TaxID=2966450 RepID=UPI00214869D5|nr:hypothetical protein [Geothrix sp. SG10]